MRINEISLVNFKNYPEASLRFHPKVNAITGKNGVGKTNILDAIYYLCMSKSYFNSSEVYNVRQGESFLMVKGWFENGELTDEIHIGLINGQKKQIKKNKKEYERISDHIGQYPVVMVSPADASLVLDGSDERRKYMNGVISQYNRTYLEKTIQYNRVLAQRNKYLKESRPRDNDDLLEVLTEQLSSLGDYIYQCRKEFCEQLFPVFHKYYHQISGNAEEVEILYQSPLDQSDMQTIMNDTIQRDIMLQHTSMGIHKDDMLMNLQGFPLKKVASQGQQKTFLVALKMAQFEFLKKIKKINPILLLDDIFDKFDSDRVKQIIRLVAGPDFGQIFITHPNEMRIRELLTEAVDEFYIFKVEDNGVNPLQPK